MHPISHYIWYCHRLPERSFFYRGRKFPVCARCTGVWIGYVLGLPISLFNLLPWWFGIILLVPALLDGGSQLLKWRLSTNALRLVTGIALGIGEILLVIAFGRLAYLFGMNIGVMPVIGIPLPFVSAGGGGSSLLAMALGLGMVLNALAKALTEYRLLPS